MPPRKRAKTAHTASPIPTSQVKTPTSAAEEDNADEQFLNDPWTDEEEIGLFKGLIKYKPTGIHKHFRLLALHQYMLDHGYIHPKAEHTKPAGIWRKLDSLYQLESLDERENARQLEKVDMPEEYRGSQSGDEQEDSDEEDDDADAYSEAANKIDNDEFDLGGSDFAELKWARRLPARPTRDSSPPVLPELNMADEPPVRFTPSFSIEPSEAATPTARRGRGRASTVTARQKPAAAPGPNKRRSARQAGSVANEAEDEEGKGEEGEEEIAESQEEEGEEDENEEEEEESEESTPAPRSTRNAKGARGRGGTSAKPQARGRARRR